MFRTSGRMVPSPRRHRGPGGRPAFTLVELAVVIGIIAVLISIILPVIARASAMAKELRCANNTRTLMQAFLAFAGDNKGRLPGNDSDNGDPDPVRRCWMGPNMAGSPQGGTIWKYIKNPDAYLCPTIQTEQVGGGFGSNSKFDYASFKVFAGARVKDLAVSEARFNHPDGRVITGLPIPVVVEEDANQINAGNRETGHSNVDQLSHVHRGGSYYGVVDGSVYWFVEPTNGYANNWQARGPSKNWANMGTTGTTWGYWDKQ
ncbi:MAG TPA: type II secretion system protein [Humisphaera sp.]